MLIHGLGWSPDQPDARDATFAVNTLALAPGAATGDLRPYLVDILDQEILPSCVAQALPQAIRMVHKREEPSVDPPLTSRFWTWYYARLQHGDHKNLTGTYIRHAVKALNQLGRPAEESWPQVTDDLDRPRPRYRIKPPPHISMEAYDHRRVRYHRVSESGDARRPAVQASVSAGMPIVLGTQVGYSFIENDGAAYEVGPPLDEPWAGGHAMVIVAYDEKGVWLCNSWGKRWRAAGLIHVSWEYITWHQTMDLWAISLSPAA